MSLLEIPRESMTQHVVEAAPRRLRWLSPASGLWVAMRETQAGDDFAGFVELVQGEFRAHDGQGTFLGAFASREAGRDAIEGATRG
ncbi:hypothetical protein C5B85_15495 [Pseudoclavibacter sp. AY1F1]|uniref:hypothetical protein n=1 Tax=Pseudoclavibacter sp. AY1F1 TaxID=2080583 RepID=UPI000CE7D6B2|nr:hypothetical protein [Pseudoclavibacter sp. AY1F1]PPF42681.1 hypothetical protein C5B85_15495 [Pseudoclavibacter sp. AY1F1]